MMLEHKAIDKKVMFSLAGLLLLAGIATAIAQFGPQPNPAPVTSINNGIWQGEYLCIPHKDTSGPQTLECALGIKTAPNTYFALDMGPLLGADFNPKINTGTMIEVIGNMTPLEMLSTDHWQKYNMKGIIQVKSIREINK
jgi:hypothetical protein